jgi:ribosomal protein L6P/L9E
MSTKQKDELIVDGNDIQKVSQAGNEGSLSAFWQCLTLSSRFKINSQEIAIAQKIPL